MAASRILGFLAGLYLLWLNVIFIGSAHGFNSPGKAILVLVLSIFGLALVLALLMSPFI